MLTRKVLYPHEQSRWAAVRLYRRIKYYVRWQRKYRQLGAATRHLAAVELDWCKDLQAYCMFVGYPRSGHSIIGALLDAHPDMLVAHERGVLRLVELGLHRNQIFHLLRESSEREAATGRFEGEYRYEVPGQWQGRFRKLKVIGDKEGGLSAEALAHKPGLLEELRATLGLPLRVVHVVRNPFDNITTFSRKRRVDLRQGIDHYFMLCAANARVRNELPPESFHELRHEDLVADPGLHLRRLCTFLGVEATDDYVDACASIVFKEPRPSRKDLPWPEAYRQLVEERMAAFPFLAGYTYES